MGSIVQAVAGLFGGGSNKAAKDAQKAAQQERELTQVSQAQQRQAANDQSAETSGMLSAAKSVRGSRLLISRESGGLGLTLGTA